MVTVAVAITAGQVAIAGIVYVTVYVPAVLVDGIIAPVEASIDNPAGETVYVPPVVPVRVTFCGAIKLVQYGDPE